MVFLVITPQGLKDAIELAKSTPLAIWCGADAITEAEYLAMKGSGISRFVYPLLGEPTEILNGALETIVEHHPNQRIWVEHVAEP